MGSIRLKVWKITLFLISGATAYCRHQRDRVLAIWSAGCSSGEEPYNISIVIKEFLGAQAGQWDTRVLATDISQKALATAKRGVYELPDFWARLMPYCWWTNCVNLLKSSSLMDVKGMMDAFLSLVILSERRNRGGDAGHEIPHLPVRRPALRPGCGAGSTRILIGSLSTLTTIMQQSSWGILPRRRRRSITGMIWPRRLMTPCT